VGIVLPASMNQSSYENSQGPSRRRLLVEDLVCPGDSFVIAARHEMCGRNAEHGKRIERTKPHRVFELLG
jgi:hypothetical protein